MLPLVSIIIPVYNGKNFLRQAINSALSQTYANVEVIVVNDGSNDDGATEKIALSYGKRIRYFAKTNGGVASALNYGISQMKGKYFSWLSHDDMYTPDKIEEEVKLAESAEHQIVCCNVSVVTENGMLIKDNHMAERKRKSVRCFMALDTETGINGCALLIPREAFVECGLFKETLQCTQDYDMWARMAEKYTFVFSEKQMVLSRQHPAQDSKNKTDICTEEADALHSNILNNIELDELEKFEQDLTYYNKQYHIYYNAGYKKTAAQILIKLLGLYRKRDCQYSYRNFWNQEVFRLEQDLKVDWTIDQIEMFEKKKEYTLMFYSNVWTRGGIERVLSQIMPELLYKYNIVLVSNDVGEELSFEIPNQILHLKVGKQLEERLPFSLLVLSLVLKVDVFIGNPNIILSFLDVYKLLEDSGIRTIACNHGNYFIPCWSEYLFPVMMKRRKIYPLVSAVTWLTSLGKYLGDSISGNGYLLPNPNTYEQQEILVEEKREKIIVCVGRFYDPIKRVDRALKVFREVLKRHPDAKLQLVGRCDLNIKVPYNALPINSLIEELDFPDTNSIEFIGEVKDVRPYYKRASIQILVSSSEGFPLVLNEGGVFGCPSVIFEIPGLEDVIEDGENGFILPQDDIKGMADKISALFENPELLLKIRKNAISYSERFKKDIIVKKWERLLETILKAKDKTECEQFLKGMDEKYSGQGEEYLFNEAVQCYRNEIQKVRDIINKKFPSKLANEMEQRTITKIEKLKKGNLAYRDILEIYEQCLISLMELTNDDKQIKYILEQLPLNDEKITVGVYGTGVHTNKMLNAYERIVGEIKAKIVFIDTKKASNVEKYMGRDIYNVKDIGGLGLNSIILSSNLYEDEMYSKIKELYGDHYIIYRFYENSKQRLFN